MKKNIFIICMLLVSVIVMFSFKNAPQAKTADNKLSVNSGNQIVAYYFHGAFRCPTCLKMEQYSKEAIEKYYGDEIDSGKLVFKVINVEEKGNEHFVNDYRLYTKSLILSLVKDGKEINSKNLDKIWEYVGNKQKFLDYVSEEVKNFLRQTQ